MGIRSKIILLILLVVGMFILPTVLAWRGMDSTYEFSSRMQQNSQVLVTLHQLESEIQDELGTNASDLEDGAALSLQSEAVQKRANLLSVLRKSIDGDVETAWIDELDALNLQNTSILEQQTHSPSSSGSATLAANYASMERNYNRFIEFVKHRMETMAINNNGAAQNFAQMIVFAILATGVAALGLATLLTRRIVRPIGTLSKAARDIAQGNYGGRVKIGGHDELGELGGIFNNMASSLQLRNDALIQEQSKLRSVHQSITDGIIVFGTRGFMVSANPAAEAILGSTEQELAGSRMTGIAELDAVLEQPELVHQSSMARCWEQKKCKHPECGAFHSTDLRCWLQCGDNCREHIPGGGSVKSEMCERCDVYRTNACANLDLEVGGSFYSVSVAPILNDDLEAEGRLAVLHDISGERDRTKQLRLLYEIVNTIASGDDITGSLQSSLELCIDAMEASSGSIMLLNDESLLSILAQVGLPKEVTGQRQSLGEGIAGWVAMHGEPLLLTEDDPNPRFRGVRNIRDAVCIPIMDDEGVVGVMSLNERKAAGGFTGDSLDFLAPVAVQMGTALSRAKLNQKIFEEKEKSTAIVESMGESLCVRDRSRKILFSNPAHKQIFGEDSDGRHCYGLYVGRDCVCSGCPLDRCFDTGETVRRSHFVVDRDGKRRQLETTASPIRDADGNIVSCIEISRDVTEMLVIREKAESRLNSLTTLFEVSNILSSSLEMRNILQNFTASALQAMHASTVSVMLFEDPGRKLVVKAVAGETDGWNIKMGQVMDVTEFGLNGLVSGSVPFRAQTPADLSPAVADLLPPGSQSVLFGPLSSRGKLLGMIIVSSARAAAFSHTGQLDLFQDITNQASVAIDNAAMYLKLEDTFWSIIRSLAEAIDAKDSYTRGHSDRVADYAEALARRLKLEEEVLNAVRCAGYLHDTGKIGIPDAILNKPGRLTEEEYSHIMSHPVLSHKIIEPVEFPYDVKPLVRHHHERIDGCGYPDGLKGDDIPLGARIIGIADAFEAMTSDRPYRKALSFQDAAIELKRCAGSQFDAALVDEFLIYLQETQAEFEMDDLDLDSDTFLDTAYGG
jgi:PAS domain S-box-containing protein